MQIANPPQGFRPSGVQSTSLAEVLFAQFRNSVAMSCIGCHRSWWPLPFQIDNPSFFLPVRINNPHRNKRTRRSSGGTIPPVVKAETFRVPLFLCHLLRFFSFLLDHSMRLFRLCSSIQHPQPEASHTQDESSHFQAFHQS